MQLIRNHPWGIRRIAAICLLLMVCNGSNVRAADQSIVVNGSAADMNQAVFEEIAEHAIKIAWRNWGRQIRVLPPPNFMSQRYREACHDEMNVLVPLIVKWWQELPQEKKHLLSAAETPPMALSGPASTVPRSALTFPPR